MDEYTTSYQNAYHHNPHHPPQYHDPTQQSHNTYDTTTAQAVPPPPLEAPILPPATQQHGGFLSAIMPSQMEEHLPLLLMGLGALGVYLYIKKDGEGGILGSFLK